MNKFRQWLNEQIDPRILQKIDRLPKNVGVQIWEENENDVTFSFGYLHEGDFVQLATTMCGPRCRRRLNIYGSADVPYGDLRIVRDVEDHGECNRAFEVLSSFARPGFGIILYEVALEYASSFGSGLMADREVVSDSARGIWDKYLNRSDVSFGQLDIDKETSKKYDIPQLTPEEPRDDCEMGSAMYQDWSPINWEDGDDHGANRNVSSWEGSALSKHYYKNGNDVTEHLEENGRLFSN